MAIYKYWGFGLHIASEMEFQELLPFAFITPPDVSISIGITPQTLTSDNVVHKVRVSISPTEYLLKFLNTANYYVTNGNKIIVEPAAGGDEKSIRLFLLSNAMAAVLHQRDMIPMHASAIEHYDGIVLFCGQSGAGKSTTVSKLQQTGYKVFSDDVCVLRKSIISDDKIEVFPSYPMIKLWQDSFDLLGMEMAGESDKIRPGLPKYARFYHDLFTTASKEVKKIFILEKSRQIKTAEIKKLGTIEAFSELQKNTYRYVQMNAMQKRNIHFDIVSKLIAGAPAYKISRPEYGNSIDELTGLIELHLQVNA